MIYEYVCYGCKRRFDVVKPVSQYKDEETCKNCGSVADRVPFPQRVSFSGTSVEDKKYNQALGVVCTDSEARRIAKSRGMIEVGNESISKHADQVNADHEKAVEKSYEEIWKGA